MKNSLLIVLAALVLTSCVSTSNLFQDGKTLGKDSLDVAVSVSINQVPQYYDLDAAKTGPVIKENRLVVPWIAVQAQYGVTQRLDLGGGAGLGIYSAGVQGFAKYALLPRDNRTGIALMALGSATISDMPDDEEDITTDGISYLTSVFAMPISFPVSKKVDLVLQPMYGTERLAIRMIDEDPATPNKAIKVLHSYRLGTGLIVRNKNGVRIHYNVTTAYYPDSELVVPTLGVALYLK